MARRAGADVVDFGFGNLRQLARAGLDRASVAAGAPAWEDARFRVPRILDEE